MVTERTADTCPCLQVLREQLGKDIECENCSYLFCRIRPLAFHRGISVRSGVLCAPPTGHLHFALFLLVRPSAALHHRRHLFLGRRCTPFSTTMAGKSQILPADAWARSSVTERKLEELVCDGLL
jgi:hypothetical protein